MMTESALELTVWTNGPRAATAAAVIEAMGERVRVIGVGGPRAQGVAELARGFDGAPFDDFRHLAVERPARYVLLASMEGLEPEQLHAAMAQGGTVLTLEPVATSLQVLASLQPHRVAGAAGGQSGGAGTGRVTFVPAFAQCPGFVSAAEPFEVIGAPRAVAHESVGPAGHGSLFARLFDTWRTVLRFTDVPESVDAALVNAEHGAESLRELAGTMTAHARMPDGSAAVVHVGDRAARSRRALHVLGDAGELRVGDAGYTLHQLDDVGTLLDADEPDAEMDYPALVAAQWRRLVDRPPASDEGVHDADARALACCMACLLSARTAEPESPERVLQMNR